jgi:cytochrome c-type biogenesis protein CcmH/NrfF
MNRLRQFFVLLALLPVLFAAPAYAVKPDEMLADPVLEARAREISEGLRCMVCQNQSIDESDADLARDLRILVRERLKAGDSDRQVVDYIVSRYGEFVLLKPRLETRTLLLWGAPLLLLLAGAAFMIHAAHARREVGAQPLTDAEKAELDALLRRD